MEPVPSELREGEAEERATKTTRRETLETGSPPRRGPSPPLLILGLGLLVATAAILFQFSLKKPLRPRLWSVEELALYNGTEEGLPILLGILGSVFDVTKGRSHYGPGGGYHHFAGRDASRAFVSGNFSGDGLTDSLHGLSSSEDIITCSSPFCFFRFVGKLVGRYYDSQGNPTKYLKGVEAKAKRGAQLLEKQKIEEARIPSCNSRWSQQEGGKVWCDAGYPRLVKRPADIALTGKISQRCACFKEEELGRPGLEVYKECDYLSTSCKV
ncbi:Membrane-associated progesterone-binding protein 4 [Ananas comosus]|uniref:Membrane-associated progesterone-binding protein 4 n=1 Tax=Ananas comosus TaxID=4615 RepID=A0A199VMJ1_ANACO|nr:Membrane-associated progesterone-binding protein 4 [Ananas comosus]